MSSREAEEQFERAIRFFRGGFFPSALQEFRHVERLDPEFPNISYLIAATQKRVDEVAGRFVSSLEDSFDEEIHQLSESLQIEGNQDLGPEVARLLRNDRSVEALEKLQKAALIVPDSRPLLLMMAQVFKRLGKFSQTEDILRRANLVYPKDGEILNNLGNAYLAQGQFNEARRHFKEALELLPDNCVLSNNLASLEMQMYRLDSACRIFEEIVQKHPNWKPARKNLENLIKRMQELENEIGKLRKEYHDYPNFFDVGINLGKALLFRGYFVEAQRILENVIEVKPDLVAAYFYLGNLHEIESNFVKAVSCYKEMVEISGKATLPEFSTFCSLLQEGYVEEALSEIKKIAVLDLDLAAGHITVGIRYFEDADWKKACEHFEKAVAINDAYPDGFYWRALTRMQMGKTTNVKKDFEKAVEINPKYADAHYQLGMLLRKSAPKKAQQYFELAIKTGIRPQLARIAEEWLKQLRG